MNRVTNNMMSVVKKVLLVGLALGFWLALPFSMSSQAASPEQMLGQLNDYPHAQQVAMSELEVIDHEVGLGAMQKVRGAWQFKNSERLNGLLSRYTWQIVDGFTSEEVMEGLVAALEGAEGSRLLFSCEGRACGQGVQWANRVFRQRVLYGREDLQRYRVFALEEAGVQYRVVVFSAARTADRQYLHVDLLRIGG
jgi:hypothetical protein